MNTLASALALFALGGVLALLTHRSKRWATRFGVGGAVLGSLLGLWLSLPAAINNGVDQLSIQWSLPYGSFSLALDALSAFFLLPIFLLSALGALYGVGYQEHSKRRLGVFWFFYNGLVLSMVLAVTASNAVLFLMAWETMALSSFFLLTFELGDKEDHPAVREAGIVYLIATQLGTACLLLLFLLLGHTSPSLDFDALTASGAAAPAGVLFLLALLGFGTKAGFVPLHVWLPEAHPVAPSHVSALMSGAMIKTGIYALLRIMGVLGQPSAWWGWTLLGIGLASALMGVVFALAQRDLKRLLAYSSVENIGIIGLGLGLGVLGQVHGIATLATLGYAGALLHVLNHSLFKGLLFLSAGAVKHATGSLHLDALGGLMRRMPLTGSLFLFGAVAISGLPPLNGFISEFLLMLAALDGSAADGALLHAIAAIVLAGLGLIGGLALAAFTKAFGIVFLGEARTPQAAQAKECHPLMLASIFTLAAACVGMALFSWALLPGLAPLLDGLTNTSSQEALGEAASSLRIIAGFGAALLLLVGLFALLRRRLLRDREERIVGTWGCGYLAPSARMQYRSSSYADPLTRLFTGLLRKQEHRPAPTGVVPEPQRYERHSSDPARSLIFAPLHRLLLGLAIWLRPFQSGRVQLYVLYIAMTLLALLAFAFWS
ncbi:MAG: proton-conducting transporter membrane subunit [Myxococcota bacterium]|nr:proton-conducting transporter membrane subunit [Myxococcota bacterium]